MLALLFVVGLVYHIILMLASTLTIAALTLVERKALSIVQRRVGPNFVGYRGRLQYIADALKLLTKGTLIPDGGESILVYINCFCSLYSMLFILG